MDKIEVTIYAQYIAYLKTKQAQRIKNCVKSTACIQNSEKLEKHRILPGHAGGTLYSFKYFVFDF